jgi:hypothetical protein
MWIMFPRLMKFLLWNWLTLLFLIAFFVGWVLNALGMTKFDLTQLQGMFITMKGAGVLEHGINSKWNSENGNMPEKEGV